MRAEMSLCYTANNKIYDEQETFFDSPLLEASASFRAVGAGKDRRLPTVSMGSVD